MPSLGDALFLTTLGLHIDNQLLPQGEAITGMNVLDLPVYEANLAALVSALVGLLTGWSSPQVVAGQCLMGPTFAPSYLVRFTRL